jgi:haloalkane dehalogenase
MESYNKELYPFDSKWINIEGNSIHYLDEGHGDVILFSHPPLASSFMYRNFIKILSQNYRCIALDYPGFGLSGKSDAYNMSLEKQGQVLEQFMRQLNLNCVYGLGHDTGGPSLFSVAAKNPDWFRGLILTDTIIFPVSEYPKVKRMLEFVGGKVFTWLNAKTNILVKATYRYGIRTRKLSRIERMEYQKMFDTASKRKQISAMLNNLSQSEGFMEKIKASFEGPLNTKPTLLIYGEDDPVHKLGIAIRIHQMLPSSVLHIIDKEGHFPHEGQPEKMSALIDHWIRKIQVDHLV